MKLCVVMLMIGLWSVSFNATAFGSTGHQVIGHICDDHLSPEAKAAIKAIMGDETLSEASVWADDMRTYWLNRWFNRTFWSNSKKWHFINIPQQQTYQSANLASQSHIVTAITAFSDVLKDNPLKDGPIKEDLTRYFGELSELKDKRKLKKFAVRFLIHFIGDLHQPLHAGFKADLGGNLINVSWMGETKNLHHVWDVALVDGQKLSASELANKLSKVNSKQKTDIQNSDLMDWLQEVLRLRHVAYKVSDYNSQLNANYVLENTPIINEQMQKGGLRAAKVFNEIFTKTIDNRKE